MLLSILFHSNFHLNGLCFLKELFFGALLENTGSSLHFLPRSLLPVFHWIICDWVFLAIGDERCIRDCSNWIIVAAIKTIWWMSISERGVPWAAAMLAWCLLRVSNTPNSNKTVSVFFLSLGRMTCYSSFFLLLVFSIILFEVALGVVMCMVSG